jgi:hypothetical protein
MNEVPRYVVKYSSVIHTWKDVKLSISKLNPIKNNITGGGIGKSFKYMFTNAAKKYTVTEKQSNITSIVLLVQRHFLTLRMMKQSPLLISYLSVTETLFHIYSTQNQCNC